MCEDIDLALRAADWPTERRNTEIRATYRVNEVTAIHSGLEQQEGLEYGLEVTISGPRRRSGHPQDEAILLAIRDHWGPSRCQYRRAPKAIPR